MAIGQGGAARAGLLDGESAQEAVGRLTLSARRAPAMQRLLEALGRLARDDQPVWLRGEPGSGRHTAARALHALSPRHAGPLLVVPGTDLQPLLQHREAPDKRAAQEAEHQLMQLLAAAASGTLVFDAGRGPELALQTLLLDLLASRAPSRLVLITALAPEDGDESQAPPMLRELAAVLRPRCLTVPPLRQRREEIVPLATELLREHLPPPPQAPEVIGQPGPGELVPAAAPDSGAAPDSAAAQAPETIPPAGPAPPAPAGDTPADAPQEAHGPAAALIEFCLADEAATTLEEHPWPGNLWQLHLCMRRLAGRAAGPVITALDLSRHLPGYVPVEGQDQADPLPDPDLLQELGEALADLLRTLIPTLPSPTDESEMVSMPLVPLLLYKEPQDPPWHYRLRLGPGPMDEGRLVAGLQARPLGPSAGFRTGDAPALGRLGPMWRGHLLAILRAAHRELDDGLAPSLSLYSVGQLLLLAGPPIPPDKLVRLALRLPVDLLEEETATLLERLRLVRRGAQGQGTPLAPCTDPALGRAWADAARGLLPARGQEVLMAHAEVCERCAQAVLGLYCLPGLLGGAPGPRPAGDQPPAEALPSLLGDQAGEQTEIDVPSSPPPAAGDRTQVRIGTGHVPPALLHHASPEPGPAAPAGQDAPTMPFARSRGSPGSPAIPPPSEGGRVESRAHPPPSEGGRVESPPHRVAGSPLPEHRQAGHPPAWVSPSQRTLELPPDQRTVEIAPGQRTVEVVPLHTAPRGAAAETVFLATETGGHPRGSAASPVRSPPLLALFTPAHWALFGGLFLLVLLLGTALGVYFGQRLGAPPTPAAPRAAPGP